MTPTYAKSLMLSNFQGLGINPNSDKYILPDQYGPPLQMPYYKGDGQHSVNQLEELCRQFQEYCHQQAVIKQTLILYIKP